jgi:integrase
MSRQTHVISRGFRYYHRIRIPKSLKSLFKRSELIKSLRTSNAQDAHLLGSRLTSAILRLFQAVKLNMGILTTAEIEDLTRALYARLLEQDTQERFSPDTTDKWRRDPHSLMILEDLAEEGQSVDDVVAQSSFSAAEIVKDETDFLDLEYWETTVRNRDYQETDLLVPLLLEGTGIHIEPGTPEYRQLGINAARALIEAKKVAVARAAGDINAHSAVPLFLSVTESYQPALNPRGRATVQEVFEKFMAERDSGHPAFRYDYQGTVSMFLSYFGDSKAVSAFTRQDVLEFKDALRKLPSGYQKKYPGVPIKEAIKRNEKDKHPTISYRTINDGHLSRLSAIFAWAANNNHIRENIARGVKVDAPKSISRKDARDPFSIDQLVVLFSGPVFAGCKSLSRAHEPGPCLLNDERYWLPLLALFSGCRLGEIAPLFVTDIKSDGDISYIAVDEAFDDKGNQVKRRKTKESKRNIPIHHDLIALGFLSFVDQQIKRKHQRLFPDCAQDKRGSFSPFTKWFGRHLEELGLKTEKTSFHSFRHNFEDKLREHVADEELRRALAGRAFQHSAAVYGHGFSLQRLSHEVNKISYPGLDLSHLRPELRRVRRIQESKS